MKILRERDWSKEFICQICGSLLRISIADVNDSPYLHKVDIVTHYYYFDCAVCGCSTHIPGEILPAEVAASAYNRAKKDWRVET